MSVPTAFPRLHALVGHAALDLSPDTAGQLEASLAHLPAPHTRGDTRDIQQSLRGLMAVLEVLHAAQRARAQGDEDSQINAPMINGLMLAARQLAHHAQGLPAMPRTP